MKVGAAEILPVIDGSISSRLPSTKPLPDAGTVQWQEQHGMFTSDGMVDSTVGGFLVRVGDHLALVDAGAGQHFSGGHFTPVIDLAADDDPIAASMRAAG